MRPTFGRVEPRAGRYRAVYTVPKTTRDRLALQGVPCPERQSRTFTLQSDAHAWLEHEHQLLAQDLWAPPAARPAARPVTLREFANQWLDRHKPDGTPLAGSTRRKNRKMLDQYVLPALGDRTMRSLRAQDLADWLADFPGPPASKHYCVTSLVRPIFRTASTRTDPTGRPLIDHDISAGLRVARPRKHIRPASVSFPQIRSLASHMPDRLALAVYLGFLEGLRVGEVLALRRCDVDMEHGLVAVTGTVVVEDAPDGGSRVVRGRPKTQASDDTVPLLDSIRPLVRAHLRDHVGEEADALLFPASKGGLMRESTFNKWFRKARARVPGMETVRFHDARHNLTELLEHEGAPVSVIRHVLRHARTSTTLDVYMDVTDRHRLQDVMGALSRASRPAAEPAGDDPAGVPPAAKATRGDAGSADKTSDERETLAAWLETQPVPVAVDTLKAMGVARRVGLLSLMGQDARERLAPLVFGE